MGISLVTGATGFLGSHLVDRLVERGEKVRVFVRPTSNTAYLKSRGVGFVTGDVADEGSVFAAIEGVKTVYHAAAMVDDWAPWREFESVTIGGTRNVVAAAVRTGARLLYVSSDAVYAFRALKNVVTEQSPVERTFAWFDYYRRAKALAEQIVREAIEQDQIEASIVRPGLLLGERDQAMFTGMRLFLKSKMSVNIGSGHNRLPFVYVGDVAEACIQAATHPAGISQIYNVASDESVNQRDLLRTIANATGVNPPKRSVPISVMNAIAFALEVASMMTGRRWRPAVTRYGVALLGLDYREDISKIRNELGWEPKVRLNEAIDRTVSWEESQRNSTTDFIYQKPVG